MTICNDGNNGETSMPITTLSYNDDIGGEDDTLSLITILSGNENANDQIVDGEDDALSLITILSGNENIDDENDIQIGLGDDDPISRINIISATRRDYPRFGASGLRLEMKFNNPPPNCPNLELWLALAIIELLELIRLTLEIQPQDWVGLNFNNANCVRSSFSISFRRFDQYTTDLVFTSLVSVLQSNQDFLISDTLTINVDHIQMPLGFGRSYRLVGSSFKQYVEDHPRTIYSPQLAPQHAGLCLAVAIVLGEAYADGVTNKNKYNYLIYPPNYDELIAEAYLLCQDAGVDLGNGGGLDEIRAFQDYLYPEYDITVYNCPRGKTTFFKGDNMNAEKKIRLLLEDNHYVLIKSTTAAFGLSYYCEPCNRGHNDPLRHRNCPYKCPCCYTTPPCMKQAQNIMCDACNRGFRSALCFDNHLNSNVCSNVKICGTCYRGYKMNARKPHTCDSKYCRICCKDQPIRHECYMPVTAVKESSGGKELFIFYDFECTQDKSFQDDRTKFQHKPNLCVVQVACSVCSEELSHEIICKNCGVRSHTFKSDDVVEELMLFIGRVDKKFKTVTILAHNMQGYDGHFCLRYMYQHKNVWGLDERSLIMNGTKILKIKVGRFTFLDSLNFFMVPLAKLPAMFMLESCKGYYPHYFNTSANANYIGCIPDKKYYSPDTMKIGEREKFTTWYDDAVSRHIVFDNALELEKYCIMDVSILRQACLKFRSLLISTTEIDPFKNVTIASTKYMHVCI